MGRGVFKQCKRGRYVELAATLEDLLRPAQGIGEGVKSL